MLLLSYMNRTTPQLYPFNKLHRENHPLTNLKVTSYYLAKCLDLFINSK